MFLAEFDRFKFLEFIFPQRFYMRQKASVGVVDAFLCLLSLD